jgi:O-antigen ligase
MLEHMTSSARAQRLVGAVAPGKTGGAAAPAVKRLVKRKPPQNHSAINPIICWTFYFFIFSLPWEWPERPIPFEIPTLIGFIYIGVTLLQPGICYRRPPIAIRLYAVYICIVIAFCIPIKHTDDAIKFVVLLIQIFLLMWTGYNLMRYEQIAKRALWALALSCSLISLLQVMRIGTTEIYDYYVGSRHSVLGQNPNNLANNISLGMAAVIGIIFSQNSSRKRSLILSWLRYILLLLPALMITAILDTGSRGAILAFGLGFTAFAVRGGSLSTKIKSILVVLVVLAGLVAAIMQSPAMVSRFKRSMDENNMSGREDIFPTAWSMFKERPLAGWGPVDNMYELGRRIHYVKDLNRYKHSLSQRGAQDTHNMYLEILTSIGLIGAIPLFTSLILCIVAGWQARRGIQGSLPLAMVLMVLLINASGNWVASKLDFLLLAYALAGANQLVSVRPRPRAVRPQPSRVPAINPSVTNPSVTNPSITIPSVTNPSVTV